MGPRRISSIDLASVLPPGGLTLVSSCCAESDLLAEMVRNAGDALGDMRFSGIFVPGLNRQTWHGGGHTRVLTFFQTTELRKQAVRTDFLPLSYRQIQRYYRENMPSAVLFMCSPPDEDGNCSFGPETAFIPDHWRNAAFRIAHVNPSLPRTAGHSGIPFKEITAFIEANQPLRGMPASASDEVSTAIARHVAPFIDNGATLQTGLGKIPDAVLDNLTDRRDLRIHSGLIGDGVLRLVRSGAMANGRSAIAGVAIGSPDLYAGLSNPHFEFRPVSYTHNVRIAGSADHLVTINSALQADLFGQCYAEVGPVGAMSGPGGASDFAAAAQLSRRGVRIVAFPATAARGQISRIAAPADCNGPVSLGRMDVDIIATEHGAADLRGLSYDARAEALIGIAAPEHQQNLLSQWASISDQL